MKGGYLVLIAGIVLLATIFFTTGAVLARRQLEEVARQDSLIKSTLGKLNSARILDQQLSQFRGILIQNLTNDRAFSEDELRTFSQELARLVAQNQLEPYQRDAATKTAWLEIAPKHPEPGMAETTCSLHLRGTFARMGQFIAELEALDQIVRIRYLDISPVQPEEIEQPEDPESPDSYLIALEFSLLKVVKGAQDAGQ